MTPSELLLTDQVAALLRQHGIVDADGEARAIVEAAACRAMAPTIEAQALQMAQDRAGGAPLGYVTGSVLFMGVRVTIAPGALVPRAETELLGASAIRFLDEAEIDGAPIVVDMCCGSGNLACAIAIHRPHARVWACDLTDAAVAVASANVTRLGLDGRVSVRQGDLFGGLSGESLEGTVDVIVCNPPYISTGKLSTASAALLQHEPREAFDGGPYGVSIFQRMIRESVIYLKPAGALVFEIGLGQERPVVGLFQRSGQFAEPSVFSDSARHPRVVGARKKTNE